MRHIPNLICLLRMVLVWPVATSLRDGQNALALGLFVVAAISDGLDGFLAKRYGWTSALGKLLDPMADKLLIVTVFITATWLGLVPWWLAAAAIARDVMIGLGALIFRLWFGPLKGRPTVVSKINTLFQLAYLVAVMFTAAFGVFPQDMVDALAYVAFVTTVLSGGDYVYAFTRRAWDLPPGPIRPTATARPSNGVST